MLKWTVPDRSRTSLLYVDGHFVCLGEYGKLRLFRANPEKFELVAEVTLKRSTPTVSGAENLLHYPCWAAPILSHGLLYLRGRERLLCLELIPDASE